MIRSVGYKLILAVGIAIAIVISAFSFLNLQTREKMMINEMRRHTIQLSETVKNATMFSMLYNHREHISHTIMETGKADCIREVRIFNKAGVIKFAADSSQIGSLLDKRAEACFACHAENEPIHKLPQKERTRIFRLYPDSTRRLGVITPIYNQTSCWNADCHAHSKDEKVLGVLDITMCLKQFDQQMVQARWQMAAFALVAILLSSLIIWLIVRRFVDKPVSELVEATKTVASGNLNYRIENPGKDELGALAESFNNMTQKLSEARLQLFQSDKMASMGRLAAGVAHEINNPLTGILTYSSYLLKEYKNNRELSADLEVIVRETKRSREIVKGLLDFARQSVPKKNVVHVREAIEKALEIIDNQLSIQQIKLDLKFASNLPAIRADSNQLQQVIINLVENATYAVERGGKIRIETALISQEAFGFTQIKNAACPQHHALIDPKVKIDGYPGIKVLAAYGEEEGLIYLNPVYGKNKEHRYLLGVPEGDEAQMFCPECRQSLLLPDKLCPKCHAHIYQIIVDSEGRMEGCTRKGCDWQEWKSKDAEGRRDFVRIVVEDNGSGISQENLENIFDPFFTTKGQKGTGLGLAVIWGIVDNHDGRISVESTLGEGTRFSVYLPVE